MGHDARMDAMTPTGKVRTAAFHQDHSLMSEIATCAAIFLWNRGAQQAKFASLLPCFNVHLTLFAPAIKMLFPFIGDEFTRHVGQHHMLVRHPI